MATKTVPNLDVTDQNVFRVIWYLTRLIVQAGGIYKASGDGNGTAPANIDRVGAADLWGVGDADPPTNANWLAHGATLGNNAWWCAELPSTWKVPIAAQSVGTFLKGEKVTTAGGAEAEILGYLWDTAATSYVVITMRVGAIANGDVITGASTGATVQASATPIEFVHQVVFFKGNDNVRGIILNQCVERVAQSDELYSYKATLSDCTGRVAPGCGSGGATNNYFAINQYVGSYVTRGGWNGNTGAAQAAPVYDTWFGDTAGYGKAQIVVVNMVPAANVTPDGTYFVMVGKPGGANGGPLASSGFCYSRVDNMEDGDCDPYVMIMPHAQGAGSGSWKVKLTYNASAATWDYGNWIYYAASTVWSSQFSTTLRRGYPTGPAAGLIGGGYMQCDPATFKAMVNDNGGNKNMVMIQNAPATPARIVNHPNHPAGTSPLQRHAMFLGSAYASGEKQVKGTMRAFSCILAGSAYGTSDNKAAIQFVSPDTVSGAYPGVVFMPWDGVTVPLNT